MNSPQQRQQEIREWLASDLWGDEEWLHHEVLPYLLARVQQLESALEYYANAHNYSDDGWTLKHLVHDDEGERAHTALTTMPEVANPLAAG